MVLGIESSVKADTMWNFEAGAYGSAINSLKRGVFGTGVNLTALNKGDPHTKQTKATWKIRALRPPKS